ncbi:proteasome endopeptidase complex, archaeal, alpha subunit [Halobacteriales archaeon QS_3_64_16]|nr:MAG: proteasome endopeptidase complex, archaeal, alpha subunit [Halobacteriales archaeon QS_3_64_16]
MQQNQQQAYDRGITIFSPDGRLYQVEYAREAVKRGSASIGVRTEGGVALLADRRIRSSLMEPSSVEKLHKADDHVGIASAGHVADARQLIDFARRQAQVNRLRYEEPVGVEALTKEITDNIQQYTQVGGARPFGVALIVGGIENGEPRLYETDPSGVPTEWKSVAIGNEREAILEHLEENYRADADLDGAIDLALSSLASAKEEALDAESVLLSTVDAEEGYRKRSDEEIDSALSELDLDTEEEGEE